MALSSCATCGVIVLVSIISSGALAACTNSVTTALEISGLGSDSTTVPTRLASSASDGTHSSVRWATACRRSGFVSKPTRGILPDRAVAMAEPALPRPTIPTVVCIVCSLMARGLDGPPIPCLVVNIELRVDMGEISRGFGSAYLVEVRELAPARREVPELQGSLARSAMIQSPLLLG